MDTSPAFGQADLTNCERELIHLAGSIQPHGVLLVLRERDGRVLQVSANSAALLGLAPEALLLQPLGVLGGDLDARVQQAAAWPDLADTAQALHMAASTLQRRLAMDGTSFQSLKDELDSISPEDGNE